MMSKSLSRSEVAALAVDLRGMLAAIEDDEVDASVATRHRIEGAFGRLGNCARTVASKCAGPTGVAGIGSV